MLLFILLLSDTYYLGVNIKMSIKVSIVVPIYNVEKYIEKCINSLLSQTYSNLEIVLVDDGSTDESGKICDYFAREDSRIKVVHKKNGGLSSARKAGINCSTGEYIMIVDGDDWIDVCTVQSCIREVESNEALDCVLFSYMKEFPEKSLPMHVMDQTMHFTPKEAEEKVYRRLFGLSDTELAHPERMDNIVSCCMKLYKTEVARKGQYFDNRVVGSAEDALFNMYALYDSGEMLYLDKCFYHYRKTETSITNAYRNNLEKKWTVLFSEIEKVITVKQLGVEYKKSLLNRIAFSIVGIGMNEVGNTQKSHWWRYKKIRNYLKTSQYREACNQLNIKNMPIIWKVFFVCCKMRITMAVYGMLLAIMVLRRV